MLDKPKRRWFQFRLRTLLIVIALLATALGWLGWQLRFIRSRRMAMDETRKWAVETNQMRRALPYWTEVRDPEEIPWYRRALGDATVARVLIINGGGATDDDARRLRELFPEADIWDGR